MFFLKIIYIVLLLPFKQYLLSYLSPKMKFLNSCWMSLLELYNALTLSSTLPNSSIQPSLQGAGFNLPPTSYDYDGPVFEAPSSPEREPFKCDYTAMNNMNVEWANCSRSDNRGCWLRNKKNRSQVYDINTNYEDPKQVPKGVLREYVLDIGRKELNLDGITMPNGVVFNNSYPGPWIQACWGDDVQVTVINSLDKFNGSTIHWHGIRQLNTMQYDGVNGVTQCPIAPGSSFTYRFKALQYGTTWYHSHYSLQYSDGLVGPLTIHGPSSHEYDDAIDPILMTDWNHRSAFEDFSRMQFYRTGPPSMDSILLNGAGTVSWHLNDRYQLTVCFQAITQTCSVHGGIISLSHRLVLFLFNVCYTLICLRAKNIFFA